VFLKNLCLEKGDVPGAMEALGSLAASVPPDSPYAREALAEKERLARGEPDGSGLTFAGLLAKLDSKEAAVRRDAMQAIVGLGLPRLPARVVRAVRDEDELVRVLAVSELGRVGGPEAVGILEILLLHPADRDRSERVRGAGARALAALRTPAAVPVLVAAIGDESFYVFALVSESLSGYTGLCFHDDPSQPVPADRAEEVRARWRAWWASPRSFGAKCEALVAFESLRLSRLTLYVAALLGDQDPAVAGRARATFFSLTGEQVGTEADLATVEGRARLRQLAEAVLEKRRASGRK
jgi:hypothetical protein